MHDWNYQIHVCYFVFLFVSDKAAMPSEDKSGKGAEGAGTAQQGAKAGGDIQKPTPGGGLKPEQTQDGLISNTQNDKKRKTLNSPFFTQKKCA